jgi:hypothetical protein
VVALRRCFASWIFAVLLVLQAPAWGAKPKKALPPPRIVHIAVGEQAILTPVPIWVESHDASVARVVVRYRPFGSTAWSSIDLAPGAQGFGGEISCRDVGTVTGTLRYFVVAYDAAGKEVGTQGSDKKPLKVKIRRAIKSPPPHLPGKPPPGRCNDASDCPPDFPGCVAKTTSDDNACTADDDCEEGMTCGSEGKCAPPPERQRKNWITVGGLQDFVFFNDANYCTASSQGRGDFSCLRQSDGAPYDGTPLPSPLASFYGPATTRVFLGYDRFVGHFAFGLRGGYVVRGLAPPLDNRRRSLPLLAEARVGFWFSVTAPVRPMLFIDGGYAPYDMKFHAVVHEDTAAMSGQVNPASQTLDVWTTFGPWFAGGGAGVMFATSSATGFILEVEVARTFPIMATVLTPALSFAVGF